MRDLYTKLFVLIFVGLFSLAGFAQNKDVLFYEDFSENGIDNWTEMGVGATWIAAETNDAGGEVPEALLSWNPTVDGVTRLVSPLINTSGYTSLELSFLQAFAGMGSTSEFDVRIETTSDGGQTFNLVAEWHWIGYDTYQGDELLGITNADVGSENFQIAYTFEGLNIDTWLLVFDNVSLQTPSTLNDVGVTEIFGFEDALIQDDDLMVSANVQNYGANTSTFDVKLEIADGANIVFESIQTVTDLGFGESLLVDFENWEAQEGYNYTATVTSLLDGDENPDNDQLDVSFSVYPAGFYCIPSGGGEDYNTGFTDFAFAGIENYNSGFSNNGYGYFPDMMGSVEIGETYTASFTLGYGNMVVSMWMDLNGDMQYDESELMITDFDATEAGTTYSVDISIPANAQAGSTHLRIAANFMAPSSPDPCATFGFGEWEDYPVQIENNVGVSEQSKNEIKIFPNPSNTFVTITSSDIIKRYQIINPAGQIILENNENRNENIINISHYPIGVYYIKIFTIDQIITKKLVIE